MTPEDFEVHQSGTFKQLSDTDIRMKAIRNHVHQIMEHATTITQQPPGQRRFGCQKINAKCREILAIVTQQLDANPD